MFYPMLHEFFLANEQYDESGDTPKTEVQDPHMTMGPSLRSHLTVIYLLPRVRKLKRDN